MALFPDEIVGLPIHSHETAESSTAGCRPNETIVEQAYCGAGLAPADHEIGEGTGAPFFAPPGS